MKLKRSQHLDFILGGNALFTVKNEQTGNRFTFKIRQAKDNGNGRERPFFVSLLNGPDNYSNYQYMGNIWGTTYESGRKSKITKEAQASKVFIWMLRHLVLGTLPEGIELYHEGKCGCCGRKLTVPESIQSGFGPKCIQKINVLA